MWADAFRSATCRSFFHCSLLQLKVCVRARVRQGRGGGGERCVLSRDQPARPPCSRSGSLCCGCSTSVSRSAPLSSVTDPRRAGSFRVRRETDSRIQPVQLGLPEDSGADAGGGCSLPGRTGPPPRLPERGSGELYPHIPPPSLLRSPSVGHSVSQPPPAAPGIKLCFPPEPTSERCVPLASAGRIGFFAMLSGPARHRGRPGGIVRCLVSACLLSLLLEARGSYPQSGECKGKGKDCTGKTSASSTPSAVNQPLCFE